MNQSKSIRWWLRRWSFAAPLGLAMAGCAATGTLPASQTMGSVCASAGAAMAVLAVQGTPAQNTKALQIASTLTPACSASTPSAAVSAAVLSAVGALDALAAPYQSPTGSAKS